LLDPAGRGLRPLGRMDPQAPGQVMHYAGGRGRSHGARVIACRLTRTLLAGLVSAS
jgi:hypothetical protein